MQPPHTRPLPGWLEGLVASLGPLGLFVVAFLDSSFLSFPVINDVLVMHLSMRTPAMMPVYALMATLGSLAGSLWLYWMARKGREWFYRRHAESAGAAKIRRWIERNSFLSVAIPSILPPPTPFKAFVIAAGGFGVPLRTFILALLIGRGLRYFGEGILAVRYGDAAIAFLLANKFLFAAGVAAFFLVAWVLYRLAFRERRAGETTDEHS
jgi:membrane protein YqaA with SNARE-associated domain